MALYTSGFEQHLSGVCVCLFTLFELMCRQLKAKIHFAEYVLGMRY